MSRPEAHRGPPQQSLSPKTLVFEHRGQFCQAVMTLQCYTTILISRRGGGESQYVYGIIRDTTSKFYICVCVKEKENTKQLRETTTCRRVHIQVCPVRYKFCSTFPDIVRKV